MQLNKEVNEISIAGADEGTIYGIENSAKAAHVLSGNIYSEHRAMEAFTRELVTNAQDSHIAAGTPQRPLEVHIPTMIEPFYSVQDYGIGMYDHEVELLWGNYFKSLSSQVKEATGCHGLGSKSPFAYTSMFTVHAVKNGIFCIYQCYKDGDDRPRHVKLSEGATNEPNGVLVTVPVEQRDVADFEEMAVRTLLHLNVMPEFSGNNIATKMTELKSLLASNQTLHGKGWRYFSQVNGRHSVVNEEVLGSAFNIGDRSAMNSLVLGSVSYPLDFGAMAKSRWNRSKDLNFSEIRGLVLDLNVATEPVDIDPGRENLQYTDQTCTVIDKRMRQVLSEVDKFIKNTNGAKSRWDVMAFLNDKMGRDPLLLASGASGARNQLLHSDYPFTDVKLSVLRMSEMKLKSFRLGKRASKHDKKQIIEEIIPSKHLHVLVKTSKDLNRAVLSTYLFGKGCHLLVIEGKGNGPITHEKAKKVISWLGNPECVDDETVREICERSALNHKKALDVKATSSFIELCTTSVVNDPTNNGATKSIDSKRRDEILATLELAEREGREVFFYKTNYRSRSCQVDAMTRRLIQILQITEPSTTVLMVPPQAVALATGFKCMINVNDRIAEVISAEDSVERKIVVREAAINIISHTLNHSNTTHLRNKLQIITDMIDGSSRHLRNVRRVMKIFTKNKSSWPYAYHAESWHAFPGIKEAAMIHCNRFYKAMEEAENSLNPFPMLSMIEQCALNKDKPHFEKTKRDIRDYVAMVQGRTKVKSRNVVLLKSA